MSRRAPKRPAGALNPKPKWLAELHRIVEIRVASNIEHGGNCWRWTGYQHGRKLGYGSLHCGGRHHLAHRFMYAAVHGAIPPGLLIRHACDNRRCVNPDHLEVGTHQDNVEDAYERDRVPLGERHRGALFTDRQVLEAVRLRGEGRDNREIEACTGIPRVVVSHITGGHSWGRLTEQARRKMRQEQLRRRLTAFADEDPAGARELLGDLAARLDRGAP